MSIEEKVLMANVWSVKKDIKREIFERAYQDWREKRDRLERRKDTVMAIVFVVYMLIAGVVVSIVWGGKMKKHLVIKYFYTYPENKFYFDSREKAREFLEEKRKVDTGYLTTYEYRGEVILNPYQPTK